MLAVLVRCTCLECRLNLALNVQPMQGCTAPHLVDWCDSRQRHSGGTAEARYVTGEHVQDDDRRCGASSLTVPSAAATNLRIERHLSTASLLIGTAAASLSGAYVPSGFSPIRLARFRRYGIHRQLSILQHITDLRGTQFRGSTYPVRS
jgi:hypothetical protein